MQIIQSPSLLNYNTFHVPVLARKMLLIEREEDYPSIFDYISLRDEKYLIIGEGSNILFKENYDGVVISSRDDKITIVSEDEDHVWIKAGAGSNWHQFVLKTIEMGLQGLENLSLIPGKVGAAPIQNIGAYGVEADRFIDLVNTLDLKGKNNVSFSNRECHFSYRTSIFKTEYKGQFLIKSVVFRLNKTPEFIISYDRIRETLDAMGFSKLTASAISQAVIAIRKSKLPDPSRTGNAGSFFKNPVIDKIDFEGLRAEFPGIKGYEAGNSMIKISAAWLIEQCGWKSRRKGDAGVYKYQPLVLINYGKATGKELFEFAMEIRKSVADKFGILLEPEVNII